MALLPVAAAQPAPTRLADLNPGGFDTDPNEYVQLDTPNGLLVLFAATGRTESGVIVGRELWATDGTVAGTRLVADIRGGSSSSSPTELIVFDDAVYFARTTSSTGRELCRSDGTEAGTAVLKDVNLGTADAGPQNLTVVGDQLFFFADDGTNGLELWVSDGTENGTALVKDIYPGALPLNRAASGFNISLTGRYAGTSDTFYFIANDGTTGLELWSSDGTESGTDIVRDINPGNEGPQWLRQFTTAGGLLFFESYTNTTGREVWVLDGTEAGAVLIADLGPGSDGSSPTALTAVGSEVFFFAYATANFTPGLYRTNGTSMTLIESGIEAGDSDDSIAAFGTDRALLNVLGSSFQDELWIADRNQATLLASDIVPVLRDSEVFNDGDVTPVTLNGRVFFTARTSTAGTELYTTDGTVAGTTLAADLIPGSDDGGVIDLFALASENLILLSADDPTTGIEPVAFDASSVILNTPIPDQTVTATESALVDLTNTFISTDGAPLSYTATSSNPSVLDVSTDDALQRLRLDGIAFGNATVTVTATSGTGQATTSFAVEVTNAPLVADLDVRVAHAAEFCTDPTDLLTCDPVSRFRFNQLQSDTLEVGATEAVLLTYVVTNTSPRPLTSIDVQDSKRGDILNQTTPNTLAPGDSVIVNRLTAAGSTPGLALARVHETVTDDLGRQLSRFDTYGLQVVAPEVDLAVRIADDAEVCDAGETETNPDSCLVTTFQSGQPRSDTLQTEATEVPGVY